MRDFTSSGLRLGILGGGQLGKMLIQAASRWDIHCAVLDPDPNCAASTYAHSYTEGPFSDYESVMKFGDSADLFTIEIENVNTDALRELREQGKTVSPSPEIIDVIRDKGRQKRFYVEHQIPTAEFWLFKNREGIVSAFQKGDIKLPFVQKARREGYDGRGVVVIGNENEFENLIEVPALVEEKIEISKEIAVIVSRNKKGEMNTFLPVEMEFNRDANLVEMLIAPARLEQEVSHRATLIAKKIAQALGLIGVIAIEMFLTSSGDILVNESAPRPHNSGHHTIEANESSQYEQHLRAILDLPLGSCSMRFPSVMINILGAGGGEGPVRYRKLEEVLATAGCHLHLYGKKKTKPFRKMGHITLCGNDLTKLIERGNRLKNIVIAEAE